jgi:hypothetical protein
MKKEIEEDRQSYFLLAFISNFKRRFKFYLAPTIPQNSWYLFSEQYSF